MKRNDILFLLGSGFILIIAWIIFSVYHERITSTIPDTVSIQIQPISGTFDVKTVTAIRKRQKVAPQLQYVPVNLSITPTPRIASASATPTAVPTLITLPTTPISTTGGQITP